MTVCGYSIKNDKQITLDQIVDSLDGDGIYRGCGLGLDECDSSRPCSVHDQFIKIRYDLKKMLKTTSTEDLKKVSVNGKTFLVR